MCVWARSESIWRRTRSGGGSYVAMQIAISGARAPAGGAAAGGVRPIRASSVSSVAPPATRALSRRSTAASVAHGPIRAKPQNPLL